MDIWNSMRTVKGLERAGSILGGFEDLTGSSPEQSGLISQLALLEEEAGLETSCGPFQLGLCHDHMVNLSFMLTSVTPQLHLATLPDL